MEHYTYYQVEFYADFDNVPFQVDSKKITFSILVDWARDMSPYGKEFWEDGCWGTPSEAQGVFLESSSIESSLMVDDTKSCEPWITAEFMGLRRLYAAQTDTHGKSHDMEDWVLVWEDGRWDRAMLGKWRETEDVVRRLGWLNHKMYQLDDN